MNPLVYRHVARHLADQNRPQDAVNVLGEAIQSGVGVFACLVEMGDIAYRFQAWDLAAQVLSRVAEVEPGHTGHLLRLCHARIETGDFDGARSCLARIEAELNRQGLPAVPETEPTFEQLYLRLSEHHRAGDAARAGKLLDLCIATHPFAGRLAGKGGGRTDRDALRRRIDEAWHAWERGTTASPAFAQDAQRARIAHRDDVSGVKVLMVMRRYFNYSASSREHELYMMFRRTAAAAGIDLRMVEGDPMVMPYGQNWRAQSAALDACVEAISETRPDVVIFDALCEPHGTGELFGPETYRSVLGELKRRQGFKLIGFYPDAWTPGTRNAIGFIHGFADGWWTSSTAPHGADGPSPDPRRLDLPTPFDPAFYPGHGPDGEDGVRDGVRFFGSVAGYNYTRSAWLLLLERLGTPFSFTASNHDAGPLPAEQDYQRYADALMASRACVNFSGRNLSTHITTGRVFETVLARALLLEERNTTTPNFFVPYVHYVPFNSAPELDCAARLFLDDEALRRRMVDAAGRWMAANYSPAVVWKTLIAFALGLPDQRGNW